MKLPNWPPNIDDEEYKTELIKNLKNFCLSNSLSLLLNSSDSDKVIQAPVSLFPTPFPKELYVNSVNLQLLFNELYISISNDYQFLDNVLNDISKFDEFQLNLWTLWKSNRDSYVQPNSLLISRSDYMLNDSNNENDISTVSQVEFNTISSSFGGLSNQVNRLHNYLFNDIRYRNLNRDLIKNENLPENRTLEEISNNFEFTHRFYIDHYSSTTLPKVVLVVIQDNERNIFDQRLLEYELSKKGIMSIRRTFKQLSSTLSLNKEKNNSLILENEFEVSIVYYRAGYTPTDYPTEIEWNVRSLIESSLAIKCPSLALQLAGCKKVQQILLDESILKKYLRNATQTDINNIMKCFVKIYPFDNSENGKIAKDLVRSLPKENDPFNYVLKPQREGGGNNIYKEDIYNYVQNLNDDQLSQFILMELIKPPTNLKNILCRYDQKSYDPINIISELGIFGACLFNNHSIVKNANCGHLLRTKSNTSNEGGVAVGISVIDEILLI